VPSGSRRVPASAAGPPRPSGPLPPGRRRHRGV